MPSGEVTGSRVRNKGAYLAGVAGSVVVVDFLTKLWIVQNYALHQSVPVLGDVFRITYTHNVGAAFGISIGEHSRLFFLTLAVLALAVLGYLYRETPATDRVRLTAVALVCGGAVGNILDRIRYERGVVDFLDLGIGSHRWYVFNVADMAVSVGAILLIISFYREETAEEGREAATVPEEQAREGEDAVQEATGAGYRTGG